MESVDCPRCEGRGRSYWTREKELRGVHFYDEDIDGVSWFICMECGLIFTADGRTNRSVSEF